MRFLRVSYTRRRFLLLQTAEKERFMFFNQLMAVAIHTLEPVAKWVTLTTLFVALVVCGYAYLKKSATLSKTVKITAIALSAYFLFLTVVLFIADLAYHYSDEYAQENWLDKQQLIRFILLPLCALISSVFLATAVHGYAKSKNYVKLKGLSIALILVVFSVFALTLFSLGIYYAKRIENDGYFNSDSASVKQFALYTFAILLTVLLLITTKFEKQKFTLNAKAVAYAGVCVSMSFALSYIKLWDMPSGGALTLASLLPLALYSYAFGIKKGLFAGFCYILLQAIQDPWIIHPAQFLLDYPIAFTTVGLAGIFRNVDCIKNPQVKLGLGCAVVGTFRYTAHVLSGIFAFEAYAAGQNPVLFSLGYNLYVLLDIALVIAVAVIVTKSKLRITP